MRRMLAKKFLECGLGWQDARHELIDGVPLAMTGARQRHRQVAVNARL
jgi:hypothetical protein